MAGATAALSNEDLSPTLNTSEMSRFDKEIIEDAFSLTLDYISYRLRSKFEQNKLSGLPRRFLIPQTPTSTSSSTLRKLATLMEAEHPDLFESLCTTLGITPVTAYPTFVGVAQEIFQAGTNWGRIVALFTFGGVVAHHFVETQRPEMVQHIVEWIVNFIADNLLTWIRENGGWVSVNSQIFVPTRVGLLFIAYYFKHFFVIFLFILPTSCTCCSNLLNANFSLYLHWLWVRHSFFSSNFRLFSCLEILTYVILMQIQGKCSILTQFSGTCIT